VERVKRNQQSPGQSLGVYGMAPELIRANSLGKEHEDTVSKIE
jgi:hypothetical protein